MIRGLAPFVAAVVAVTTVVLVRGEGGRRDLPLVAGPGAATEETVHRSAPKTRPGSGSPRKSLVALSALASLVLFAFSPAPARASAEIVDRPVSFVVTNKNDSLVPCDADGNRYTIHGSLVAPASVLERRHRALTLWIHGGLLGGDNLWRMRPGGDDSYDFGLAMARLGHASVSVELVGYGRSVTPEGPDGMLVCQGSQADVIHQVVDQLRSGGYVFGGEAGPSFQRVAVGGLSYGPQFVQPAIYSFPGTRIDATVIMGYADPPMPKPDAGLLLAKYAAQCVTGRPKYDDGSGPGGYHLAPREAVPNGPFFNNDVDPKVEQEVLRLMERDPCGQAKSFPARIATDAGHIDEIAIPLLIAHGALDEIYQQPGPQEYFLRFTGSPDRTLMLFPGAGHVFFLEQQRAKWIRMISGWLTGHDL